MRDSRLEWAKHSIYFVRVMKIKYVLALIILTAASSFSAGKCAATIDSYGALFEAKTIMCRQSLEIQNQINALQLDINDLNRRLSVKQLYLNQAYRELSNLQRSIREVDCRI